MKRLLALLIVWTLLVITGTLVSADGQTRRGHSRNSHAASQALSQTLLDR